MLKNSLEGWSCTSTHLPMASASAVVVATTSLLLGLMKTCQVHSHGVSTHCMPQWMHAYIQGVCSMFCYKKQWSSEHKLRSPGRRVSILAVMYATTLPALWLVKACCNTRGILACIACENGYVHAGIPAIDNIHASSCRTNKLSPMTNFRHKHAALILNIPDQSRLNKIFITKMFAAC